ncbi:MAG: DUF2939 domain-containing protein [Proteobacteria bacterium]|nr:DUF2939 domain-containing protein [Pseudomonadota bacterium]
MKKIYIAVAAAVVLLLAGYVAAGPYLALNGIRDGIVAQDEAVLAEHIDFPVLRESMKEEIAGVMTARMAERAGGDPEMAAMGQLFASKMVEVMVDKVVTPQGLAMLTSTKEASQELTKDNVLADLNVAYEGLNRAVVTQANKPDAKLVLSRQGLKWRLTGVRLPTTETAQ